MVFPTISKLWVVETSTESFVASSCALAASRLLQRWRTNRPGRRVLSLDLPGLLAPTEDAKATEGSGAGISLGDAVIPSGKHTKSY